MVKPFKKGQLGVNLGLEAISIVQSDGKNIVKHCRQDFASFGSNLIEIAEDEIKFAAVLQKILRECEFDCRDASVALPASDVIVRFFQIPLVQKKEISSTVNFEARKYIPFRIEELAFDFSIKRKGKNFDVIFSAVKKKILDRYLKALNQVGFNVVAFEPASLSFLRAVLAKSRLDRRQTSMILNINNTLTEGDIVILEAGDPCFIRDIKLSTLAEGLEVNDPAVALNKLINEIRISTDYFRHRQPSSKNNIAAIIIYSENKQLSPWAESISSELGIKCSFFCISDLLGFEASSIDMFKATGASLRGSLAFPIEVNLLKKEEAIKKEISDLAAFTKVFVSKSIFKKLVLTSLAVILIIATTGFISGQRIRVLERDLNRLNVAKQKLTFLPKTIDLSEKELGQVDTLLSDELESIEKKIEGRIYLTEKVERLAALLPDGVWLNSLTFRKDVSSGELEINANVYLPGSSDPLKAINGFLNNLRSDSRFSSGFSSIALESVRQANIDDFSLREFQIRCR